MEVDGNVGEIDREVEYIEKFGQIIIQYHWQYLPHKFQNIS